MKKVGIILGILTLFCTPAMAADVELIWESAALATGYKVYQSTDAGSTWDAGTDVGNVTTYELVGVPDSGLVLFRISAYNSYGETITSWQGGWYCGDWMPPQASIGLRVNTIAVPG